MDAGAVTTKLVGWLEESPGVKSSSRLFAAILLGAAVLVVLVALWYVIYFALRKVAIDSNVLLGFAAIVSALVAQGCVLMVKRGNGE